MKKFTFFFAVMMIAAFSYGQVFTGVNWVTWANEPDYEGVTGYAENPYENPTYTVLKAPASWTPVSDVASFDATWEVLGDVQFVSNPGNIPGGDLYDLGAGNTFGASWKAVHDGVRMYVLIKYLDINVQADDGSLSFEIMAQPKDPIRHELTFEAGVAASDMAKKNMAYCRYVELGGGKAMFKDGGVTAYEATGGFTGSWVNNTPALEAFLDLEEFMFWDVTGGVIRAVLPLDFAGVLSYPNDPANISGTRTALGIGEMFAFDVKSNAKVGTANTEYWWAADKNNGYASNYYSGHVTLSETVIGGGDEEPANVILGDFEDGTLSGWSTWGGAATNVDNPAPGGINTSSKVLQFVPTGAWQGINRWDDQTYNNLTPEHAKITVDVYSADATAGIQILFVDSESGAADFAQVRNVGVANTWVTLEFDISGLPAHDYKQFAFQNTIAATYFFDNIVALLGEEEVDVAFTGVNWVAWANEPDYAGVVGYAENPYDNPTYNVYKAPASWTPVTDDDSFDATWNILGPEQLVSNVGNSAGGDLFDLGAGNTFGASWKALHDGERFYVLLKYMDTAGQALEGTKSFEITAQPKSPVRHEPTFNAGVAASDMAKKNMAYARYVELGGGKAVFKDGIVSAYEASAGMTGSWVNNTPALEAFLDLDEYMYWSDQGGIIRAIMAMDFAGVLSYPKDPREMTGERNALKVGEVFAFDVKTNARHGSTGDDGKVEYWWSSNVNNGYASNYYSGHLTLLGQEIPVTVNTPVETRIGVYPNPARDMLNVVSADMINEVRLVNMIGQIVYSVTGGSESLTIPVDGFDRGMYLVQILTSKGVAVERIIINR